EEVVDKMIYHGIRRIPIIEPISTTRSKCVGIITLDDLLAAEAISLEEASQIAMKQIHPIPHRPSRAVYRSVARKQQTALRFRKTLAQRLRLDEEKAEGVARIVLRMFVRRINTDEASHLISQLPALWQDELFDLPAGPDRSIRASDII